jgi:hypothetical protein
MVNDLSTSVHTPSFCAPQLMKKDTTPQPKNGGSSITL